MKLSSYKQNPGTPRPVSAAAPERTPASQAVSQPQVQKIVPCGKKETLLVVEDEPSVRHLACVVLEAQGYEVLSAENGQDGLEVVNGHQGSPIDLVVTDVVMPTMGGKVMADWLQMIYPEMKILFTSGHTADALAAQGVEESGGKFLPKPYTPVTLAGKVREMLDC